MIEPTGNLDSHTSEEILQCAPGAVGYPDALSLGVTPLNSIEIASDTLDYGMAEITALLLSGPPQSLFGRYAANDQIGLELVYQW